MSLPNSIESLLEKKGFAVPKNLVKLPLYTRNVKRYSFEEHLINGRFRPFQILQLLLALGFDTQYIVGYERITLFEINEDNEDEPDRIVKEYGPTHLQKEFSGEELFESVLARLGFLAAIATEHTSETLRWELREDLAKSARYLSEDHETFIASDPFLVITSDAVFVARKTLAAKLRLQLSLHEHEFSALLASDSVGVPHETYIGWLLSWFPGRVKLRSIEYVVKNSQ